MTFHICAADFECVSNGKPLLWNEHFEISVRWRAAMLARGAFTKEEAAETVTKLVRHELGNNSVTITVRKP